MKFVIVGCGRVGAALAEAFDNAGHEVIVLDTSTRAFDRLSDEFKGQAIRGDGTDEDVLRKAGVVGADVLLAFTEGDNRNVMAAQVAMEKLSVGKTIAKINDPVRAAAYADLGIATVCRTTMLTDAVLAYLDLGKTGMPSVIAPVPHVHEDGAGPVASPVAAGAGAAAAQGQAHAESRRA
ncbi:MAG TPA: TrkA family potassium uptake protein [Patescibacteria group bacterium]|nr:TrkA family potassium uptake protein [Patescibacteria group bacterium]